MRRPAESQIPSLQISTDGGVSWQAPHQDPASLGPRDDTSDTPSDYIDSVVADPALPDTIYANMTGSSPFVARTDNLGMAWTPVITPTTVPALASFAVSTNPNEPGLLVATATDGSQPADQVFASRAIRAEPGGLPSCPGEWHGNCPALTVRAGLTTGQSLAFFPDGVHAFMDHGPSGPRLPLSDHLPVPVAQITSVTSGTQPGDPILSPWGRRAHAVSQ